MRGNPIGPDWVLIWAGTIALLRAVGHALLNEDTKRDARLKKAQSGWMDGLKATEPKPSIFFDFIKRDRDRLLKEAELTVAQAVQVFFEARSAFHPRTIGGHNDPQPPIYTYHMKSGPFVEHDPRDLVRDAIEWWEKQLDDIEQKAAASSP
jgi:hypothetical protein